MHKQASQFMQAILRSLTQQVLLPLATRSSLVQSRAPLQSHSARSAHFCTRPMPTLRSASLRVPAEPTKQSSVDTSTADLQLLQQQAKDDLSCPPEPIKTARRHRKPAKTSNKRASEPGAQTASLDAQQVSIKKPKARKALLSTLWTAEDLIPLQAKVEQLYAQLNKLYVNPPCPLDYATPFQLLVAVILSAQVGQTKYRSCTQRYLQVLALSIYSAICRAQTRK